MLGDCFRNACIDFGLIVKDEDFWTSPKTLSDLKNTEKVWNPESNNIIP